MISEAIDAVILATQNRHLGWSKDKTWGGDGWENIHNYHTTILYRASFKGYSIELSIVTIKSHWFYTPKISRSIVIKREEYELVRSGKPLGKTKVYSSRDSEALVVLEQQIEACLKELELKEQQAFVSVLSGGE